MSIPHTRRTNAGAAALLAVGATALVLVVSHPGRDSPAAASGRGAAASTADITRRDLSSQLVLPGSLGYTNTYTVGYQTATSSHPNNGQPSGSSDPSSSGNPPSSPPTDHPSPTGNTSPTTAPPASGSPSCSGQPTKPTATTTTTVPPSTTSTTSTTTTTEPPSTTTTTTPPKSTTTVSPRTTSTTAPPSTSTVPSTTTTTRASSPGAPGHHSPSTSPSSSSSSPRPCPGQHPGPGASPGPSHSGSPGGHNPGAGPSSPGGSHPSGSPGSPSGSDQPTAVFTSLPAVGQVVEPGQSLYAVNATPTVLLSGSTPAWRTLSEGVTGADVAQLNADLVALGYATTAQLNPGSDYFGTATAAAVERLQAALGSPKTGSLTFGQVVFLPTAARITAVNGTIGGSAQPGRPVLTATSTTRQVTATVAASQVSQIRAGDRASLTLPDGHTTPATVASVGTVATTPSGGAPGASSPPTVEIDLTPADPAATGTVDQAPITAVVTTATVPSVLAVPVAALTAEPDGHAAVEVLGADGLAHLLPVTLGLFDDANGLVQVSGPDLTSGQHVVLPDQNQSG